MTLSVAVALLTVELYARLALGLGTPPLVIAHPTIEYMFAPDQDVLRFGNRQLINEFGMRSPSEESWHQPQRALVLGDSVVNGGSLTDHRNLATTMLTNGRVFYGNVSAGSWGPANLSAWLSEYGFQGAETAIIVLSSHDLADLPTFGPLNPQTHPTQTPPLALVEGVQRYLPRYLPFFRKGDDADAPPEISDRSESVAGGLAAIERLIDILAANDVAVCVVQHPTLTELRDGDRWERPIVRDAFEGRSVPVLAHEQFMDGEPGVLYRDDIHLNDAGQVVLADAISGCIELARVPV